MLPFHKRIEMLGKVLEEHTSESLLEKLESYGPCNYIPDICYQPTPWIGDGSKFQRRIVCAANKYKLVDGSTLVIPCVRHSSPEHRNILHSLVDGGMLDKVMIAKPSDQGFIDQYSNWWSREDAFIIAHYADQIDYERNGHEYELFSEGLY